MNKCTFTDESKILNGPNIIRVGTLHNGAVPEKSGQTNIFKKIHFDKICAGNNVFQREKLKYLHWETISLKTKQI